MDLFITQKITPDGLDVDRQIDYPAKQFFQTRIYTVRSFFILMRADISVGIPQVYKE